MKKTLMKYVSLALASTLLTSCVSFLDINQNLNHQIPKGFTGVWIEKNLPSRIVTRLLII